MSDGDRIFAENDDDERLELNLQTLEWSKAQPRSLAGRGPPVALPQIMESVLKSFVGGKEELVRYAVLKGDGTSRMIIGYDIDRLHFVGDKEGLLLQRDGVLSFRPITKTPTAEARRLIAEAEEVAAIEEAKRMYEHFTAYARSHNGAFPDRGSNLVEAFFDTSHENAVSERFIYEFSGGLPKLPPAKTILGYIPAASGRAELYADGHVVWVAGN